MPTAAGLLPFFLTMAAAFAQTPTPPNVVLIYGDDVGFADVGCNGGTMIPTPNIDRLAAEGLRFTDGHCSAATCTPSRFSLLTGIHGFRHGIRVLPPDAPMTITQDMFTLPQLFERHGYETMVIGKWHLGLGEKGNKVDWNADIAPGPLEVGFDHCFLLPSTNDRVPCVFVADHRVFGLEAKDPLFVGKRPADFGGTAYPDGKQDRGAMTYYPSSEGHDNSVIGGIGRIGYQWGGKAALWDDETMTDVFVARAKEFFAAQKKDRPFFLYFSSQAIHVPRAPNPRFRGKTKLTYRGDSMVELDWATGELLAALGAAGLADNTIVIFSSDNGPVYDDGYEDGTTVPTSTREVDRGHDASGLYRGGKYQIYEGGTRVPLIVWWPGHVKPGVSDALVNQIDLLASFAKLLGTELQDGEAPDSRDTLAAFLGKDEKGLPFTIEEAGRLGLRMGTWKYVEARGKNGEELYDLATDIGEQHDVAAAQPERSAEMRALLARLSADGASVRAAR